MTAAPPRIWFHSDSQYVGGAERYLQMLLLGGQRVDAGLVLFAADAQREWVETMRSQGIPCDVLTAGGALARARALWRWARRRRPRTVHVNMPGPYDGNFGAAPWILKRAGVRRVVVTEHLPGVGRVGKRYWMKRATVPAVDQVIALCQAHALLLRDAFGYAQERIRVVYNGVAPANEDPSARAQLSAELSLGEWGSVPWIVQLGALETRKGGAELIESFASIHSQGIRALLCFVGDGPEREAWRNIALKHDLADAVLFVGYREDAARFLAAADVVTLFSHREGLPLSLLEGMAAGRAIVASAVDGIPELLAGGKAGRLVEPGDREAMASALAELCQSGELRDELGRLARDRQRTTFSLDLMRRETMEALEEPS